MVMLSERFELEHPKWQHFYEKLLCSETLASLVLTAWQIGLWVAKLLVEQQLNQRAKQPVVWSNCAKCGRRLHSKGCVSRRILTLVGWVEWKRRVGRCPNRCIGSQHIPFDAVHPIEAYQQTSVELMRLGCLLAVFVPFELAVWLLGQLSGVHLSKDAVWQWVQSFGQQAIEQLDIELEQLVQGQRPMLEGLEAMSADLPLVIATDGVTVPFRPHPKTPKGKIRFREVKVAPTFS